MEYYNWVRSVFDRAYGRQKVSNMQIMVYNYQQDHNEQREVYELHDSLLL